MVHKDNSAFLKLLLCFALFMKTGNLDVPMLYLGTTGHATRKRAIWASRCCTWGQRDRLLKNGTFGRPDVGLGDNGTGYSKTGHLGVPMLYLETMVQATRKRDVWSQ
ncbi:hypothetical protein AVEN_116059-1 [Araneus ventricosus]|uniref:Secreted protein n=1 Tax=Araneus ventricosus TaxID=182803 RepID=A0A4Y2BI19_ARAVE|nr:hypothetical protein AVEN_116059-1 [Araneus ventricosus]